MTTKFVPQEQKLSDRTTAKAIRDLFSQRELFLFDTEAGTEAPVTHPWIAVDVDEYRYDHSPTRDEVDEAVRYFGTASTDASRGKTYLCGRRVGERAFFSRAIILTAVEDLVSFTRSGRAMLILTQRPQPRQRTLRRAA